MKSLVQVLPVGVLGALGFLFILWSNPQVVYATNTTTITGWLFPDGTHFNNGIGALLFPIIGIGMFASIARVTEAEGGQAVTLVLAGMTLGGLLGMLGLGPSSTNVLPFALVVVPGIDLLVWMWKGEG